MSTLNVPILWYDFVNLAMLVGRKNLCINLRIRMAQETITFCYLVIGIQGTKAVTVGLVM